MGSCAVRFQGRVETAPNEVDTPYGYFKQISDNMLEDLATETRVYAMKKNGSELKTDAKECEKFVGMYLRMHESTPYAGILGTANTIPTSYGCNASESL